LTDGKPLIVLLENNKNIKIETIMDQKEVLTVLKKIKTDLQKKYSIEKLGVFGSFARNTQTDQSDLDIVVEMNNPSMFDLIGIKQDIEERFNKKVDIVRLREKMNKYLKHRIEREAKYV